MGLEYRIETKDQLRTNILEFLRRQPEFIREEDGALQFGHVPAEILFSVMNESTHLYLCQHVASRETDALLGLTIRRLLSYNDVLVISEL